MISELCGECARSAVQEQRECEDRECERIRQLEARRQKMTDYLWSGLMESVVRDLVHASASDEVERQRQVRKQMLILNLSSDILDWLIDSTVHDQCRIAAASVAHQSIEQR